METGEECDGSEWCEAECTFVTFTRATWLAASESSTCAVLDGGAVRCWGGGKYANLGTGDLAECYPEGDFSCAGACCVGDDEAPQSIGPVQLGGIATSIAMSTIHACAVLDAGEMRCWGWNRAELGAGQGSRASCEIGLGKANCPGNPSCCIGDDEPPSAAGPIDVGGVVTQVVTAAFVNWERPSLTSARTCALLDTLTVRCWGFAFFGLGYGNTEDVGDDELPSSVGPIELGGPVRQLAAGMDHTCVLLDDGAVRCWGRGAQLGQGYLATIGDDELPTATGPVDLGGTVSHLAAGNHHTCAVLDNGTVRCWGSGGSGRLGYGSTDDIGDDELPGAVGPVDVGGTVTQLAAGDSHTCAVFDDGTVRCWGSNAHGQLGYANTDTIGDDELPGAVGPVDVGGVVTQLAAGFWHTCALLESGAVRCWGRGTGGQLGYSNTDHVGDDETPDAAGDVPVF